MQQITTTLDTSRQTVKAFVRITCRPKQPHTKMTSIIPSVEFNNGQSIPIIGLGTWKSQPGEVVDAVKIAIACGYRHLDCAALYGNEAEVGEGIKAKIQDGTVKREDLFVTSKIWLTNFGKQNVLPALKKTLKDLGLSYLDLYLIHWPVALKEGDDLFPTDSNGKAIFGSNDYLDTWKGMEECVRKGLSKSIGVSNFNKKQIQRVLFNAEIPPVTNQVECHPYLSQKKLIKFCKDNNVVVTAYSPLGSPDRPIVDASQPILLQDPTLAALAKKYNKNPGQILIKYQMQNKTPVIPKSVTKSRIESNFQVFDFEISASDLALLEGLNKDMRFVPFTYISDHPEYPFNEEY